MGINICLNSINDHIVEDLQLASNEALLYSSYSQVISAFFIYSTISTELSNDALIAGSNMRKNLSLSWHFDSAYSRYLTLKQNVVVDCLAKSFTKIKCANRDYFLVKRERKIRLSYLKKDNFA